MKSPKKKKDYAALEKDEEQFKKFRHNFVMQTLRRATYRWPFGHMAMKKQWRDRGMYECENCHKCFGPKEVNKDHIESVIPYTGFKSWDEIVERMFVKSDQYQILCLRDHSQKTEIENIMRVKNGQKPIKIKNKLTKSKKSRKIRKL